MPVFLVNQCQHVAALGHAVRLVNNAMHGLWIRNAGAHRQQCYAPAEQCKQQSGQRHVEARLSQWQAVQDVNTALFNAMY